MSTLFERVRRALAPDYELERELGGGGMGVVFVAWEPALKRRVAVKVLRPELATAVASERFRREGETLARATHPNVVVVHKADERAGLSLLVMELLAGSLADLLRDGPLPEPRALRIGRRLLDGLEHVHQLGVVHRDVKPANIFLRGDAPVLGDFGIAKDTGGGDATLTQSEQHPGTPAYMAPEQLAGGDVRPAADLYAAGAVLYEMLTGRRWAGVGDVRRANWSGVSGPVARVLQRALAYDPRDRWPDAAGFAGALRAARFRTAQRSLLALGAMSVAAVALAITFRPSPRPPAVSPVADVAVLPLRAAAADSAVSLKLAHAISEHLEQAFGDGSFQVTPMPLVAQWWGRTAAREVMPRSAFGELRAGRIAWGRLDREGPGYRVSVELLDSTGVSRPVASHPFQPGDEIDAGFTLAYAIIADLQPRRAREFRGSPLRTRNAAAVDSLLAGDRAFWRENWAAAERLYRASLALDSTLGPAWWGLYNVQRWRRGGFDVDLQRVQALYPRDFRPLDALLIAADLQSGPARLAGYEAAARAYPNHAYPWLLLGNELFHRGPLLGIGLDSAVTVLRTAAERDPYMAPVFSTMTWALIRLGRQAQARDALNRYAALASPFTQREFCFRCVLELAWVARFEPRQLDARLGEFFETPGGAGSMARSFRFGLSFGVPEAQVRVSGLMADAAADPEGRADALGGRAVGLLALGRISQALADLDSAARLTGSDELAIQAAEWRVVLPALGLPGFDSATRASGRDALRSRGSGTGPPASRARWALALDAFSRGDAAEGRRWSGLLDGDTAVAGLRALTAGFDAAAGGDTAEAVRRISGPDEVATHLNPGDPLARAVLHLARGAWLARAHPAAADRSWLWYENSNAAGWPAGPPQAAELDWALETYARYRRAVLAQATGQPARACTLLLDVVDRWKRADALYAPLRDRATGLRRPCGGGPSAGDSAARPGSAP
jgi:hypothetical protein